MCGVKKWLMAAAWAGLVLAGSSPKALSADVTVFAAASLSDALKEVAVSFQRENGTRVHFNFAGSSTLARQIGEGARADLFFSADEEKMDQIAAKELIRKETRRDLLSNTLVIVVPNDSALSTPDQLRAVKRIALAQPESVPAGIYARKLLEQAGLWTELKSKVVPTENVRAALAAVGSGNADAAIVYKTDAAVSRQAKVVYEVPAGTGPKIVYPVAVLKEARDEKSALGFWKYLQSPAARKVFEQFGFIVLPGASGRHGNG